MNWLLFRLFPSKSVVFFFFSFIDNRQKQKILFNLFKLLEAKVDAVKMFVHYYLTIHLVEVQIVFNGAKISIHQLAVCFQIIASQIVSLELYYHSSIFGWISILWFVMQFDFGCRNILKWWNHPKQKRKRRRRDKYIDGKYYTCF